MWSKLEVWLAEHFVSAFVGCMVLIIVLSLGAIVTMTIFSYRPPKPTYFTINGVECVQVSKGVFCDCLHNK